MQDFYKEAMKQFLLPFIVLVAFVASCLVFFQIGKTGGYRIGYSDALASIKPDTEYVDKPVYIDKPVPIEVKPSGVEMYPIGTLAQMQHILDSLSAIQPDTTFIEIPVPIETKLYRDEKDSTYEAQVSGYHASLDWIKVNQKVAYITVPVPEYKYPTFSLSPTIGGFIFPNDYGVGAGLELDYWLNRWEISGGGGYYVSENSKGPYGEIKLKYNLIRK